MKIALKNKDRAALIIFIKNPQLGKAKTRIAATVGDEEALRIYKLLLQYTRDMTMSVNIDKYLYYSDYIADDEWDENTYHKRVQSNGDLGQRMRSAFESLSEDYEKIIIIGSDCMQLTADHINKAVKVLSDHDVVIGPVYDGGYYLIGMNAYYEELLSNIDWSTDAVTSQTLDKAISSGLSFKTIDTLSDIDYHEDWIAYGLEK